MQTRPSKTHKKTLTTFLYNRMTNNSSYLFCKQYVIHIDYPNYTFSCYFIVDVGFRINVTANVKKGCEYIVLHNKNKKGYTHHMFLQWATTRWQRSVLEYLSKHTQDARDKDVRDGNDGKIKMHLSTTANNWRWMFLYLSKYL